jgi:vacuolar-type H+-ATPase subunit H
MKTAVEQLLYYLPNSIKGQFKEQIEQAKEMEKKDIKDAYLNGRYDADKIVMSDNFYAEQYYNETFKQNK